MRVKSALASVNQQDPPGGYAAKLAEVQNRYFRFGMITGNRGAAWGGRLFFVTLVVFISYVASLAANWFGAQVAQAATDVFFRKGGGDSPTLVGRVLAETKDTWSPAPKRRCDACCLRRYLQIVVRAGGAVCKSVCAVLNRYWVGRQHPRSASYP